MIEIIIILYFAILIGALFIIYRWECKRIEKNKQIRKEIFLNNNNAEDDDNDQPRYDHREAVKIAKRIKYPVNYGL